MAKITTPGPSFCFAQQVSFAGGEGWVKSFQYEAETWTYTIEMAMGPEPKFGRIGGETTVLLNEADLCAA